jgi:hypothetical protein
MTRFHSLLVAAIGILGTGGGDAGGAIAIESSLPVDGAATVSVLADVQVTLTGDADPTTVTVDSVQLWRTSAGETRLFGLVAYDAETRTITFAPFDAYDHAATLELRLRGVSGPAGALADTAISFSTTRNNWTRSTSYGPDGVTIVSWSGQTYDADGYLIRYDYYNGAGDDTDWYTDDDVRGLRHDTERDDQHRATRVVTYSGAAQTLVQWTAITYDAAGDKILEVNYQDPGDNGTWFDDDDVIVLRRVSTYDAGHRLLRGTQFSGAGDDTDWGTDDDVSNFAEGYVYDADGLPVRRAVYGDPGPNDTWGDDDDVPNQWTEYQYTPERQLGRRISHSGPGDDEDWFTSDDPINGYVQYVRDDHGRQIRNVRYNDPGDNGTWLNTDDVVSNYDAYTPFAKSLHTDDLYITDPGENGTWFNDDDIIDSLYLERFADSGDLLTAKQIHDPGDDGDWGTEDDPVTYLAEWTADLP